MGHFGVISQCRINQYVNYLQNLEHLWVEYNQKGACIWCKNDWTTTQCKNLNFTQIDPHHCFQADARNCVVRLKYHFVRMGHICACVMACVCVCVCACVQVCSSELKHQTDRETHRQKSCSCLEWSIHNCAYSALNNRTITVQSPQYHCCLVLLQL